MKRAGSFSVALGSFLLGGVLLTGCNVPTQPAHSEVTAPVPTSSAEYPTPTYTPPTETTSATPTPTAVAEAPAAPVAVKPSVTPKPAPVPKKTTAAKAPAVACGGDYYVNSDGNCIHRPEAAPGAPSGATARCGDGTYSFSQHRQGTCSHHGGVAAWL
ncbi:DUF3761 domain-containing protein [Amycolatopsis sp. H20-H5]|uniref:DUF3761 domain-containing protein n=1 Tax=Amycolatopsis sp. H20-H5 TaxID=3046309 RepID=UPI002DB7FD3B|nr:DUF3761 domain-containing protein [Amycolatopsis sp. H20-H5]MEC3977839.1 DUF3761 domain-containing protein [Amycolatopsis sp. H20-H5]